MDDVVMPFIGFVLFPSIIFIILKIWARSKGAPELWYMRRFSCFRLVIRNETKNRILTDIKVKVRTRKVFPEPYPLTNSWKENILDEHEELFTFPQSDHVMICFRIEREVGALGHLIITDKFGSELKSLPLESFDYFLCDYTATIKNPFDFDVTLAKRVRFTTKRAVEMLEATELSSEPEQQLKLDDNIIDIGGLKEEM